MTLPTNKACEMADEREYFINLLMRGGVYKKRGVFKSWATYTFTDHDTMRLVEFLMALRTPAPPVTREAVLEGAANWFQWDDDGEEICDALHAEIKRQRDAGYFVGQPYLDIFASAIRALKSVPREPMSMHSAEWELEEPALSPTEPVVEGEGE